jgi:hypothetical protein
VKLELNAEYRFTIYNMFKGAVFADAGNVWLQRSNPGANGDHFAIPRVLNELAVGERGIERGDRVSVLNPVSLPNPFVVLLQ